MPCYLAQSFDVSALDASGLVTGSSADGAGGDIELVAGSSIETKTCSQRRLEGVDGPHVQMKAGDANSAKRSGGSGMLFLGHCTSPERYDRAGS